MRNDHQDALAAGLAVGEYAPDGKSADEIRALWQWVDTRLNVVAHVEAQPSRKIVRIPFLQDRAEREASAVPALNETGSSWDACL